MLVFTGLILLCLLGIRLGFSNPYISLVHQLIHYFEKRNSAVVFVVADLITLIAGIMIGGIAYLINSLFPFIPDSHLTWRIQPVLIICSLMIAGCVELYRFYIKRAPISNLNFIIRMIIGCCLAVFVNDGSVFTSTGVFILSCGLAFSTGALFSETMLKIISVENNLQNTVYFMVVAERRTSALIGYVYLGLAIIRFTFR